ncbi:TPA: PAAR domain-containing protein, partial [Escherichia coli]|nr:PAAR domain-containing protein [Escherichia coli]
LPAATQGTQAVCTGPVDMVIVGSFKVFICGKPAARMGDMCAHGGTIVSGCPQVLMG